MATGSKLRSQLDAVIADGDALGASEMMSFNSRAKVGLWLVRAQHIGTCISGSATPYGEAFRRVAAGAGEGLIRGHSIVEMLELLRGLARDLDNGLLATLAETATAETLRDLLDIAQQFQASSQKHGAGVLGGVVFEDTIRRIHRKEIGPDPKKLEDIIVSLQKAEVIGSS